jgi:spermidine synthase
VNAALLFLVQPMVSKALLPLLGGVPSVWATCLVFFQGLLLAGYLYAHCSASWLSPAVQRGVHAALILAAAASLPLGVGVGSSDPSTTAPLLWLLGVLATTVGVPFFVLAAGAPLLQRWYVQTERGGGKDPYRLYAASNLGSFAALLAYPVVVEPALSLGAQARWWSLAFGTGAVLLLAVAARGVGSTQGEIVGRSPLSEGRAPSEATTWGQRGPWLLLSAAPSSLLLGVTTFLTTDIAPAPLLWVVPLSIYLMTFAVAFSGRRPAVVRGATLAQPAFAIIVVAGIFSRDLWSASVALTLHLVAFALTAFVCHARLAALAPPSVRLTEYYLVIAVGGFLGGAFNALAAPVLFDSLAEYPIGFCAAMIALAWAAGPTGASPGPQSAYERDAFAETHGKLQLEGPMAVTALTFVALRPELVRRIGTELGLENVGVDATVWVARALLALAALAALPVRREPRTLALTVLSISVVGALSVRLQADRELLSERSYFGTYRVVQGRGAHYMYHGTTIHGAQLTAQSDRTTPTGYYHRSGAIGDMFRTLRRGPESLDVAVVGLGTGTLACYGREGERWTFYEIDPLVERIARDPRLFTYLRDCPPDVEVILGDARRRLSIADGRRYDALILDAFSSDAIPTHLITREALRLYVSRLRSGGWIAFHVSNRYVDLVPVLADLAHNDRLAGVWRTDSLTHASRSGSEARDVARMGSRWVVLARHTETLAPLAAEPGWQRLPGPTGQRVWTDDYSDLIHVLGRR